MRIMSRGFAAAAVGVVLVLAAGPLSAQTSKAPPQVDRRAIALPKTCMLPDLAVASLTIELVSTTKGQPGMEFPTDRLRITAVVKDIGGVKSLTGFTVKLSKLALGVLATKSIPAPTAAGQVWTLTHDDTYLHDRAPAYQVVVEAGFDECSKANNKMLLGLNDQVLHAQGKLASTDPALGGTIQVPGSVVVVF
jgi:hypothetical protein